MNEKRTALVVVVFFGMIYGFFLWLGKSKSEYVQQPDLIQPPEMAKAQYSSQDAVGNLGGVSVTIPRHFANYLEYEGDPGFSKKIKVLWSARTQQSKINSFGFYVRFPDMVGTSTHALQKEKMQRKVYSSMWLNVGINTGDYYHGEGALDRLAYAMVETPNAIIKCRNYEKLSDQQYGLTAYVPVGIDSQTNGSCRDSRDAEDIFIRRNENGKVTSYIECRNYPAQSASCTQRFSLAPIMKAEIYLSYRRGLLSEWEKIQESTAQLIYSFKSPSIQN